MLINSPLPSDAGHQQHYCWVLQGSFGPTNICFLAPGQVPAVAVLVQVYFEPCRQIRPRKGVRILWAPVWPNPPSFMNQIHPPLCPFPSQFQPTLSPHSASHAQTAFHGGSSATHQCSGYCSNLATSVPPVCKVIGCFMTTVKQQLAQCVLG